MFLVSGCDVTLSPVAKSIMRGFAYCLETTGKLCSFSQIDLNGFSRVSSALDHTPIVELDPYILTLFRL